MQSKYGDVAVTFADHIATLEIQRGPNNFFDIALIESLAEALETLDNQMDCRAIVLAAEGKNFCAGANFHGGAERSGLDRNPEKGNPLYAAAVRLFACRKPIVGAIQGAAIGGGFGLALVPDFRVVCAETRFAANFVALGFHPGFGLTTTLPRLVGQQRANLLFYTGRRINGEEALAWGLGDVFTTVDKVRSAAVELAKEIAANAPLAVQSTRATMRAGLAAAVKAATDQEFKEQSWLQKTEDHKEGIRAVAERRPGNFTGR
ncbi:MAG: enoyl-CoA hydratase/isomerase family protein [Deltaproteobacteria bacterium]|nr:enoyl-CoA hydratase/isomerase family protein [Deltaproteobacteria bacterium]